MAATILCQQALPLSLSPRPFPFPHPHLSLAAFFSPHPRPAGEGEYHTTSSARAPIVLESKKVVKLTDPPCIHAVVFD